MISIQTNVDSLVAQRNLGIDDAFQSKTIQQLTSGYRINSSGDDAAGLAIANGYSSTVAQLSQGVMNANDGTSQLQIVDGGLSNISTILNRLQTLATQSASATFTGDRSILNQEYSSLTAEITRQATNINLNAGGSFNSNLNVFIGGGSNATNSSVTVNLSGTGNAVDAASLGLASTNVLGGGVGFAGNANRLDAAGATFLSGSAAASETFTFQLATATGASTVNAKVLGSQAGISQSDVLSQLNGSLNQYGITAGLDSTGKLQFSGATAFNVTDGGVAGAGAAPLSGLVSSIASGATFAGLAGAATESLSIVVGGVTTAVALNSGNGGTLADALATINTAGTGKGFSAALNSAGTGLNVASTGGPLALTGTGTGFFAAGLAVDGAAQSNSSNYDVQGQATYTPTAGDTENLTFQAAGKSISVSLDSAGAGATVQGAISAINAQTAGVGLFAIENSAGTGIEFQSASNFSVNSASVVTATGVAAPAATGTFAASGYTAATAPVAGTTNNANAAIAAITSAIAAIGVVQGSVGAGENLLSYATNLANSQISSFSSAESQIKDADIAAQAANLTKAQVLTQTSVAALAQANSEPQSILKLLQ
jgi:flagellin